MYTIEAIQARINAEWDKDRRKAYKIDWLEYENITRDILESSLIPCNVKLELLADALGAWTGRGVPKVDK